jgi:basic membrane protein A and related proteins
VKKILAVLLVLCVMFSLAATGSTEKVDMKGSVAMVLSGLKTDQAFNQYTYEGMVRAATEKGVKSAYKENVTDAEQVEVIRQLAQQGYEIIIGQGGQFGDSLATVAKEYPNTKFIFSVGKDTYGLPNMSAATVSYSEAGYLGGIMAAHSTKTGKVAMITGVFYANQAQMRDSFKKALDDVNPAIQFTAIETNDWSDTDKAYNATNALIAQGYDVLFPCLDAAGAGVAAAADDAKGKVALVGSVADYAATYDCKSTMGSVTFNWEGLGYLEATGELTDGKSHVVGMAGNGISAIINNLSATGVTAVEKAKADLAAGKIGIPD